MDPSTNTRRFHQPLPRASPCWEVQKADEGGSVVAESFVFLYFDWRQVGLVISSADVKNSLAILEGMNDNELTDICQHKVLDTLGKEDSHARNVWLRFAVPIRWNETAIQGEEIVFSATSIMGEETLVRIGAWKIGSPCGVLLHFEVDRHCIGWQDGNPCNLEVTLISREGAILDGVPSSIFLTELIFPKNPKKR